jgi:hypothetical protein
MPDEERERFLCACGHRLSDAPGYAVCDQVNAADQALSAEPVWKLARAAM